MSWSLNLHRITDVEIVQSDAVPKTLTVTIHMLQHGHCPRTGEFVNVPYEADLSLFFNDEGSFSSVAERLSVEPVELVVEEVAS